MRKQHLAAYILAIASLLIPQLAGALDSLWFDNSDESILYESKRINDDPNVKKVLIINSYYNNSPIPRDLLKPILLRVANDSKVTCDIYYLNGQLITDSVQYFNVRDRLFRDYEGIAPDYVVMMGKIAFCMRKEIKERWGDIPILLLAQTDKYAELPFYFAGTEYPVEELSNNSLTELRDEYNFTAVITPDHYKETVDLIVRMRPRLKTLIYASDASFLNRNINKNLHDYLLEEYPGVAYKWLSADAKNAAELQSMLALDDPTKAILISAWSYGTIGANGYPGLAATELNLLFASKLPVFSYNQSFMDFGVLGGVYNNKEIIQKHIGEIFDQMLAGKSMREIPFFVNTDDIVTIVDYPSLHEYDIPESLCPKNTVFVNRPETFWNKYHWEIIAIAMLVFVAVFLVWRNSRNQQHKIMLLTRHQQFVDKMPIPFSKADICFDKYKRVTNITYTLKNKAFSKIIEDNSDPDNAFLLFPASFISAKVTDLIETRHNVKFAYTFDKTGTTYEFLLSFVDDSVGADQSRALKKEEVDIFANDITNRVKLEENLRDLSRQLDLTINVAGIIPWFWDLRTDDLRFDAYSLFKRIEHPFEEDASHPGMCTLDGGTEYFSLIHEDDVPMLRELRENLYGKRIKEFKARYRLRLAREGEEYYQWVEIRGRVNKYDDNNNPTEVAGAMWMIDDPQA